MDPRANPFAPGAGTQPPELAGRSGIITDAEVAIARTKRGLGKSMLLLGLRGVGKTVLLNKIGEMARSDGALSVVLEAPEDQRLAAMLVPPLRSALFELSRSAKAGNLAKRGLDVLRSFATAFKVKVGEVEFGMKPDVGTADSGNLEFDLPALLETVALAAKQDDRALVLFIDEVQYLSAADLSAIIVATHKLGQRGLPFLLIGAGLPQLAGFAGKAKSYAERLFDYPVVGPLPAAAARNAIVAPLERQSITIEERAVEHMVKQTHGYPYFLQEWGYQSWNACSGTRIGLADVKLGAKAALERLDAGFFKVRMDRLRPSEKEYVHAMAELGPGSQRSGDIAAALHKTVSAVATVRDGLIKKGMIYSPQHGDNAFTVPMFDDFLKRTAKRE